MYLSFKHTFFNSSTARFLVSGVFWVLWDLFIFLSSFSAILLGGIIRKIPPTKSLPKNGVIALWPNTRVVKCKYYVSQKQNGFNNKIHWNSILLTFIFKFEATLVWTNFSLLSNLSNCEFTTGHTKNRNSCVLLCFIKPILGNRYGPGVNSLRQ